MNNWIERFKALLFFPRPAIDVAYMRIIIFGFLAYKLLSRDYGSFGLAPAELLHTYPYEVYPPDKGYAMLGLPWVVDLATFHWIHWVLPFPNEVMLDAIKWLAILACGFVVLFGRGPRGLVPIMAYALVSYLWGYNWRSCGDIDGVFLPFQLALLYCFFREPEALIIGPRRAASLFFSKENGWFYAMALLTFALYYFYAGFNKIVDIAPWEWANYQLVQSISELHDRIQVGFYGDAPAWFDVLRPYPFLNGILVPITYLMELTIPLMFFYRHSIAWYWVYFTMFHVTTWAVGIFFFGLLIVWCIFVPIHRLIQPVEVMWPDSLPGLKRLAFWDWLGRVQTSPASSHVLCVQGVGSPDTHHGFFALRRLLWALPVFWFVLPVFYLPGVAFVGQKLLTPKRWSASSV